MTTNKQVRAVLKEQRTDTWSIAAGITADVRHENRHILKCKIKVFGITYPQNAAVHIAINSPQGLETLQLVRYFHAADITGMPDLIDICKVMEDLRRQVAMRIRQEAYTDHAG